MVRTKTFILCEKGAAAIKIAKALGETGIRRLVKEGVEFYLTKASNQELIVFPAQGHLFSLYDTLKDRSVYPVFDLEWAPLKSNKRVQRIIKAMQEEAKHADRFVNACDYDIEGETIGYNILRYVCGCSPQDILRMKFSSLTTQELKDAFSNAAPMSENLALAGRLRHYVDFIWGINLSRMLTQAYIEQKGGYRTFSMGRVQGATLHFVYQRELEIGEFVPTVYWVLSAVFVFDNKEFVAHYSIPKIQNQQEAFKVKADCSGKAGEVSNIKRSDSILQPPPAFNLGDLQRAAYTHYGYSPSKTLQLAEGLYLKSLISYPRTNSQKLPKLDFRQIVERISKNPMYAFASKLLSGPLNPRQGKKTDPAHPAIHPTGEKNPQEKLSTQEYNLYDLIVRRFLACLAPSAIEERTKVFIKVGRHEFFLSGLFVKYEGWLEYYGKYANVKNVEIPELVVGQKVELKDIICEERFEQPPSRYNQVTLLNKMEHENIGTKATRSEIISTLFRRGYIRGSKIELTELGFAVIEAMISNSPEILETELTRKIEKELESVENNSKRYSDAILESVETLLKFLPELYEKEIEIGSVLAKGTLSMLKKSLYLGRCPVCGKGSMLIIRSAKTGKRFVGCDNYSNGCKASSPLPKSGIISYLRKCEYCNWPFVEYRSGRYLRRFCVNLNCPSKVVKSNEVQSLR